MAMNRYVFGISLVLAALAVTGCGTTKGRVATEQLVASDAVDHAIMSMDFRPLSGKTVYLDTTYLKVVKTVGFVNADYVISALRQQMIAADCRLQEKQEDAEIIVEARVGTLGSDSNEVVYGIPASNALSSAAALVPNAPIIPQLPEISLARKEAQYGAAKLAVFAYERESRQPYWQSGTSQARSTSQDVWIFGAGPFQRGTIVEGVQFAGSKLHLPKILDDDDDSRAPQVAFDRPHLFLPPVVPLPKSDVQTAGFDKEAAASEPGTAAKVTDEPQAPEKQPAAAPAEKAAAEPPPAEPVAKPPPAEPAAKPKPPAEAPAAPPNAKPVPAQSPPQEKPAPQPPAAS
jgi:hypothetical protein